MSEPRPPRLLLRFFRWFCHPELHPFVEGDLVELFRENVQSVGPRRAKWLCAFDVLKLFRPSIIRPASGTYRVNHYGMWKNHFKMVGRQLIRHKLFSIITIFGLSIGLATFFIILRIITYELSYDQFHENKDNLYRVICQPGQKGQSASARNFSSLGLYLRNNFPEVKHVVRFWKMWNHNDGEALKYKNQIHYERDVFEADGSFFQVFPSLLKKGDPAKVLSDHNSIVLSESTAKRYFGDEDPLGKIISDSEYDLTVTGISYDTPLNSHFDVDIVRTMYEDDWSNAQKGWRSFPLYTYLTLQPGTDVKAFESKLTHAVRTMKNEFQNLEWVSFALQPVTEIHLNSNLSRELSANSDKATIYFLGGISLLIMVMAWINHINLSTSRFFSRTREMSIRKVIGSGKAHLMAQLLAEYLCINLMALLAALVLVLLISPILIAAGVIPDLGNKMHYPEIWLAAVGMLLFGALITGLYPSILLSRIRPVVALKGKFTSTKSGLRTRSTLVIIQFMASVALISGVTVMMLQMDHMRSADANMEVDQVIAVHNPTTYTEFEPEEVQTSNYYTFKNTLSEHTAIDYVASSSAIPGSPVGFSYVDHLKQTRNDPYDAKRFKMIFIDDDFLDVYNIPLLAGRGYSSEIQQDKDQTSLMLSEAAVRHLGFASVQDAVGQKVDFMLFDEWDSYEIIGVFADYRHESIKAQMYPSIMVFNRYDEYIMQHLYHSFKIKKGSDMRMVLDHMEETWSNIFPEKPLEYYFLDQVYEEQFSKEQILSKSFVLFSVIATVVACLGILGMTLYELEVRTKEISIRKVLGSSIAGLIALLSKKYLQLVAIAIALSAPGIFWLSDRWLENYAERISFSPWIFLPSTTILLGLVMVSSCSLIYRSAQANPVENLRNE